MAETKNILISNYPDSLDYEAEYKRLKDILESRDKEISELVKQNEQLENRVKRLNHDIDRYLIIIHAVEAVLGRKILEE